MSGRWTASPLRSVWNIGDWGAACGPRPGAGDEAGGSVTIAQSGNELTISGTGRQFSTQSCWELYPGLNRVAHSSGARSWRTTCKTSPSDPRQATIVTTITATDDTIRFDETGQYQFVIQGQNCTASVRRNRTYRLVEREGETRPAQPEPQPAAAATPNAPAPSPAPARCADPGPPARLEVRPTEKLMRAGEEFQFRAVVLDDRGCATHGSPQWTLNPPSGPVSLVAPGKVKVAEGAPDGQTEVIATAQGRSVRVKVEVVSRERYESLLGAGTFNEHGESDRAAVATITGSAVGTGSVVTRDRARSRRNTFIAAVGGAALLLGAVGLVLALRYRRRRDVRSPAPSAATPLAATPLAVPSAKPPLGERALGGTLVVGSAPGVMICPSCHQEYPPDAAFCPNDGGRLRPRAADERSSIGGVCPVCGQAFAPDVQLCPEHQKPLIPPSQYVELRSRTPADGRKICPVCGVQYGAESRFCGVDGASLVPLN